MKLTQRRLFRRSLELTIEADVLRCVSATAFKRYTFEAPLSNLGPKVEEWDGVSVSGYVVAAICLAFFGFHLREGWHVGPMWVLVGVVYLVLAAYSALHSWRKSGSYYILRFEGERPRSIWIDRRIPSEQAVVEFIQHVQRAAARKTAAAAASP